MTKYLIWILLPFYAMAQSTDAEFTQLLTSETWNIAFKITEEGEQIDEEDQENIRSNWVKFYQDGTYEIPAGISGKTIGKWTYDPDSRSIHFTEGRSRYRAVVDEISDLSLVLHYVDHGGFKLGMIHYVFIPKEKSADEINEIITSGRWGVLVKRFESIEDKTPATQMKDTWYEFNKSNTYKRSEVIAGEVVETEGSWFVDSENRLNLDSSEMTIYSVAGDNSRLILTSTTDGIRIIECRKVKKR